MFTVSRRALLQKHNLFFKKTIDNVQCWEFSATQWPGRVVPIKFPIKCIQNPVFWPKSVEIGYKLNFCKLLFSMLTPLGAPGSRKGWNSKFGRFRLILTSERHFFLGLMGPKSWFAPTSYIFWLKKIVRPKKSCKMAVCQECQIFFSFPKIPGFHVPVLFLTSKWLLEAKVAK